MIDILNPDALSASYFGTEHPSESRFVCDVYECSKKKKKCCKKYKKGKQCKSCPKRD